MALVKKSALFMRQWRDYAHAYKERAGIKIAERFIVAAENVVQFIGQNPLACAVYDTGDDEILRSYKFRKCSLRGFPHMVLFRLGDEDTLFIEALYAHKMDVPSQISTDATPHIKD